MEEPPQATGPSSGQSREEQGGVMNSIKEQGGLCRGSEEPCDQSREEKAGLCRGSGSGRVAAMLQFRKSLPRPFQVSDTAVLL